MVLIALQLSLGILQVFTAPTTIDAGDGDAFMSSGPVGAIAAPIWLAGIVVSFVWVYRAVANLRDAGEKVSPGWALGSWFIPVAHILTPVFPLRDAWRRSGAAPEAAMTGWSILWPIHMFMGYAVGIWAIVVVFKAAWASIGSPPGSVPIDLPSELRAFQVAGTFISLAAGTCFILVVRAMTKAQRERGLAPG